MRGNVQPISDRQSFTARFLLGLPPGGRLATISLITTAAVLLVIRVGSDTFSEISRDREERRADQTFMRTVGLRYLGRYVHGDPLTGANPLPFLPEAVLERSGGFAMKSVPAKWLGIAGQPEVLGTCSGNWWAGDDGDGSLTLEFAITSVDGASTSYRARATAMRRGFFFSRPGSHFLRIEDGEAAPVLPAER